jgi:hypothetical protein
MTDKTKFPIVTCEVEMREDQDTGLLVVARTNLVPVQTLQSIPERGWMAGEVVGVPTGTAAVMIKNGLGRAVLPASKSSKVAKAAPKHKDDAEHVAAY